MSEGRSAASRLVTSIGQQNNADRTIWRQLAGKRERRASSHKRGAQMRSAALVRTSRRSVDSSALWRISTTSPVRVLLTLNRSAASIGW